MILQIEEAVGLLLDKLHNWFNQLILMLPNAVLAILVIVLVSALSRYAKRFSHNLLSKTSANKAIVNLTANIVSIVFVGMGIFIALNLLNLEQAVTSLIAGAGLVGLALGLAFQDPIINTISGILMSLKKYYRIGDLIETKDYFGTIEQITLRYTVIRTFSGQKVVMPNKMIIQNPLKNYSISQERRVELKCGISYGEDLEEVKEIAIKAIEENVDYDRSKPVKLFYDGFGDSSINFTMHIWIDTIENAGFLEVQSESIIALKKAFDQAGITIPFPIRTLDFGIKGGTSLKGMLSEPNSQSTESIKILEMIDN